MELENGIGQGQYWNWRSVGKYKKLVNTRCSKMLRIIKELFVNWRTTDISKFNQHCFKVLKLILRINYKINVCVLFSKQLSPMFFHPFSPKDLFWAIWQGEITT